MKKVLLLFLMFFISPVFATGIGATASAPCDNATLNKYSGTVNAEINWEPNTIGLKWYNGDTQVSGPTSCVYDGTITVPPQPTKLGYTFNGWKVKDVEVDFSTLPTSGEFLEYRAVQINKGYCWHRIALASSTESNHKCTDDYAHLNAFEFEVVFDFGTIYGESLCSSTPGSFAQPGTPTKNNSSSYAWCKVTGYKPSDSNVKRIPTNNISWIFVANTAIDSSSRACVYHSALDCAQYIATYEAFRKALFGITQ